MEQDPGLRGMLSFLETPPEEKARLIALRDRIDNERSLPDAPASITEEPTGQKPMGQSPMGEPPADNIPTGEQPEGDTPMGKAPVGQLLVTTETRKDSPPYISVAGVGRRRLHYCTAVQDAHTSGELVAYQSLWLHARKVGRADSGGFIIDLGLKEICSLWNTDHKHAKRLLTALVEKQNIEVIRQPNYQLGLATRYRVFNFSQIYERRRARGLVWVVRTRTTKFVDLQTVDQLLNEQPMGQSPMGDIGFEGETPMGQEPDLPTGQQVETPAGRSPMGFLIKELYEGKFEGSTSAVAAVAAILREELHVVDSNAAERIVAGCRAKAPDATGEEIVLVCSQQAQRFRRMQSIQNPVGMLIRQMPNSFEGAAFEEFRKARRQLQQAEERRREAERQEWRRILDDPAESEEIKQIAREALREGKSDTRVG